MFGAVKYILLNVTHLNKNNILKKVFSDRDLQLDIAKMNVEQMYNEGVDSRGNQLGEYSEVTKKIKQKKNQKTDFITLRDTRDFHNSIKVKTKSDGIVIQGDTEKEGGDLLDRWPHALGLTDANKKEVRKMAIPSFREETLEAIFR